MSHEILQRDKQQGRHMAWHRLTEIVPDLSTENCILGKWDATPRPLVIEPNIKTDYSILVGSDDSLPIGKPFAESYAPLFNRDFLAVVQKAIAGTAHVVESVGSVKDRSLVFLTVKLANLDMFKAAGREFEPFLNFINSFDKSSAFVANTTNVCTVCNNTLQLNLSLKGKGIQARVKHTKNAPTAIENVAQLIEAAIGVQAEFAIAMDSFAGIAINETTAREILTGFVAPTDADSASFEGLSTRTENAIDEMVSLFKGGAGNRGKNLADLFSAVTDRYSHSSSSESNALRQFESSEFGAGATKKREAFYAFQSSETLKNLAKRGSAILAQNAIVALAN